MDSKLAYFLSCFHGKQSSEANRIEKALLTHAACTLMAAKPDLTQEKAVFEVLTTYREIFVAFEEGVRQQFAKE